jgi:hypothetical protein
MANFIEIAIVVGFVISLGFQGAVIFVIGQFRERAYLVKAIRKANFVQTASRLLKLSTLSGVVAALSLLAMYFTSLAGANINLWVFAYIPCCVLLAGTVTLILLAFEAFSLSSQFRSGLSNE